MPVTTEELLGYYNDYQRRSAPPTPEDLAQQRGLIGQGLAGVARGVVTGVARPVQALAAIPGVRALAEPVAEGITSLAPLPSGRALESGIESGVSSLTTGGLAAAAIVGSGGTVTPLVLGGTTGLIAGASQLTESRARLERVNEALAAAGQTPLTQTEIYTIAGTQGLIEGGGEALGNFFIGSRLLSGQAAAAVRGSLAARFPGVVGRAARETGFIAAEEVPTEAAQAASQSGLERSVLGPERVAALEAARAPVLPAPGQAARDVVGPSLVASALFGGANAALGGRVRPAAASGQETANAGQTPERQPLPFEFQGPFQPQGPQTVEVPVAPTTPGAPQLRPLPFERPQPLAGTVDPLTGVGVAEQPQLQSSPAGAGVVVNPLTGEQVAQPDLAPPQNTTDVVPPVVQDPTTDVVPPVVPDVAQDATTPVVQDEGQLTLTPQESPPAPLSLPGRPGVVRTEENRVARELGVPYLDTQVVVEEIDAGRNSFQPGFPDAKQPRITRRGGQGIDQAAEQRLLKMLADPQFERLLDSEDANRGAPLRDTAGDVISGNLRDEFLRRVYQEGGPRAERLRRFVQERAIQLGVDPAQVADLQQPVVRRVLQTPLSEEQLTRFAEEANVSDASRLDPVSAALQDARRLTPEILARLRVSPSGTLDVRSTTNEAFRRDLRENVFTAAEGNALFARDGNLNDEGVERAQRAIFTAGYGDDVQALTRLTNSEDEARQRLSQALQLKAGEYAVLANDIRLGRAADLHIGPQILEAANFLNSLETGESAIDRLNQRGLFGDEQEALSPEAQRLIAVFDDPFYRNSGAKIQQFLQAYHDLVRQLGDPRQVDTAGTAPPTRVDLLEAADQQIHSAAVTGGPASRRVESGSGSAPAAPERPRGASENAAAPDAAVSTGGIAGPLRASLTSDERRLVEEYGLARGRVSIAEVARVFNVNTRAAAALTQSLTTKGILQPRGPQERGGQRFTAPFLAEYGLDAPGQLQVAPAARGLGPVTVNDVRRAFPGQAVTQREDGTIVVTMPRQDYTLEVVNTPQITPTVAELELGYGQQSLGAGEQVLGRATALGRGLFRIEVTPERVGTTLFHEGVHFFEDAGLLTPADLDTLNRTLIRRGLEPDAEQRADLVAGLLNRRQQSGISGQSTLASIGRKVQAFFDRLAQAVGLRTTGQIVRSIERGALFTREASPATGAQTGRLQVQERPVPDATPRRSTYETELRSFLDYNSWAQALTPEQVARIEQRNAQGEAFFQKEYIPVRVTDTAAQELIEAWRANPENLRAFQRRLKDTGDSALRPSAANEAQARALFLLAEDQYRYAFDLRDAGILTPEEFAAFETRWEQANGVAHYATQALSVFGRGLRQAQEASPLRTFLAQRQRLQDLLASGQIPEADAARFKAELERAFASNDIDTLRSLDPTPPTLKNLFWELYYGSLYNIGTWSTNLWSTLGHQLFQRGLVEPLAGQIDKVFARVGQREQQIYSDVALKTFRETLGRTPQSFRTFWWLWRNTPEAQTIAPFHQRDTLTQREIEQSAGAWARAVYPTWHRRAGEPIEWMRRLAPAVTFTSRALGAMDVALREQAFNARLQALSEQAAQRTLGRPDAAWQKTWQEEQVRTQGPAFRQAFEESKVLTFHDQTSLLARLLLGARQIPGLGFFAQLLFPFANTPDRLLARGLELLPGPGFVQVARQAIRFDGWLPRIDPAGLTPENAVRLAKQMVGTLMAASLYAAWASGLITGGVPDDPEEREAFYRQGRIPYALRVGDTWYSWRRFEPMSLPLAISVSAFEAMRRLGERQQREGTVPEGVIQDGLALATVAVQSMITNILDSSYFAGAAQFLQTTQRGRETGDIPRGVLRQIATMVTPWSGIQRAAIRAVDSLGVVPGTTPGQTLVRQPEGLLEHIEALWLPGAYLSEGPEARLNIFGQPQSRVTSFLGELVPGVPPIERGLATASPVEETLRRLNYFPAQPTRTESDGRRLTQEQYRRLQEVRGPILQQRLERVVTAPGFARLPAESQRQALQREVQAAGRQAKRELALEQRVGGR